MTLNDGNEHPIPEPEVQRLREQVGRLERQLNDVSQRVAADRAVGTSVTMRIGEQKVRWLIEARRLRGEQLGRDLVADPAWSILLELFAAEFAHRRMSVAELCKASGVPESTALRWLDKLEQEHWLVRRGNPVHDEQQWAELSARGSVKIRRYFDALWRAFPTT